MHADAGIDVASVSAVGAVSSVDVPSSAEAGDRHHPGSAPARRPGHTTITYRPAFDGIRGVGLFFVLASHNGFLWAKGGFLWVSAFFTLSAYLITSLIVKERRTTGGVSLSAFWSRRFRRLMPGALLTLLGIALFGATVAEPTQLQRLRGDGLAALFYVANWHFVIDQRSYAEFFAGLANPSPVQHFWTLSIEEQFYIVMPLLLIGLLVVFRGGWRRIGYVIAGLTVASVLWTQLIIRNATSFDDVADRLYFGTDTRLPELTMGVLLGIAVSHWRPRTHAWLRPFLAVTGPMALVVIVWLTFTTERTDEWLYHGGFPFFTAMVCLLVASCAQPFNLAERALALGPLAWLGRLSYSTYLIHWPIFLWLDQPRTGLDGWTLFALRWIVVLPLAWASDRYVERPIRVGRRITGWRPWVVTPIAVAVVIGALVAVTWNPPKVAVNLEGPDQAAPPSVPGQVLDDVVAVATTDPGTGPGGTTTGTDGTPSSTASTASTLAGRPPAKVVNGPMRVLVVGDSQAWVIGNAVTRWAAASGGRVAAWNQAVRGCGIVRGGQTDRMGKITEGVCEDWPELWGDAIAEFKPHVVVVLTGGWDWNRRKLPGWSDFKEFGDPDLDAHIGREYGVAADLLSSKGATVAWLKQPCYQLEGFGQDPHHLNDPIISDMVSSRTDRVALLDLYDEICPGDEFTQELGGLTDVRPDGSHLSDEAADWLVRTWLGPELERLVKGEG